MNCPQCHGPFNDPTTFPCGHSCCFSEAIKSSNCCTCGSELCPAQMKVNYCMRDIISKLSTKAGESDEDLLPLLECPICFIPYIDPTTFPCGHSVCLEEAKELRSCPMCNVKIPSKLKVNESMKEIISQLGKQSNNEQLPVEIDLIEKQECENEAMDDEDEQLKGKQKKKRKSKNKKRKLSNDQIADLYYQAKCWRSKDAYDKLEQLAANYPLALCYCGVLYLDRSFENHSFERSFEIATQQLSWLADGVSNNDKYFLFLSGLFHKNLNKHIEGLQLLKRSASLGYGVAQIWLAVLFDEAKPKVALDWWKKAANQGIAYAQYNAAVIITKMKNNGEALPYYKMAADQGLVDAQLQVGRSYAGLPGCTVDRFESFKYFKMAADKGIVTAAYNVGCCYFAGDGTTVNYTQGQHYMEFSVSQGLANAQYYSGMCYLQGIQGFETNHSKAVELIKLAADQGYLEAQGMLGAIYGNGEFVPYNPGEAFKYIKLAGDQGEANAQCNVAVCYAEGKIVPQNFEEAFRYYKLSADQGNNLAYSKIGICYLKGEGVAYNAEEAVKYFTLSEDNSISQYTLGACYFKGDGVEMNQKIAFRYFKLSADQGHSEGQLVVAKLLAKGVGVAKNAKESRRYLRMAANQGHEEAQSLLSNFLYKILYS